MTRATRGAAAAAALGAIVVAAGCGTKTVTVERTITLTSTRTVTATTTAATTPAAAAPCAADALTGSFTVVRGSAGAGQITYRLRMTNRSQAACFVSGLPDVRQLDAQGAELPTQVSPERPGTPTAIRVVTVPGGDAFADARFSPDVPGEGETQTGACEPTATKLRVAAPGGGSFDVPVSPPTPVCEHGSLRFSVYRASG